MAALGSMVLSPPIFDLNDDEGYYRREELRISALSTQIEALASDRQYLDLCEERNALQRHLDTTLLEMKANHRKAKIQRDQQRLTATLAAEQLVAMQRASQHAKAQIRRFEQQTREQLSLLDSRLEQWRVQIDELKARRVAESQQLQQRIFSSYRVVNGRGEWQTLLQIFDDLFHRLPPAGAGECAAPKLLHYALCNGLKPLAIGEFWHGRSPRGELRRYGQFYGACRGKCHPILGFVLQGLDVESCEEQARGSAELKILYEDDYIAVVDKPAGMLSVAGRTTTFSVESEVARLFGGVMVHRLDQDTSGVMVVAKSREVHKELQRQFAMRTMVKRYIAIVDGHVATTEGEIHLPLAPNFEDRPRQMVDHTCGKAAYTTYRLLSREGASTRLELYPHTGRTHQLRLHLAHHLGLNAPILGDRLYGRSELAPRLMLHAEQITLRHPHTREPITFNSPTPF